MSRLEKAPSYSEVDLGSEKQTTPVVAQVYNGGTRNGFLAGACSFCACFCIIICVFIIACIILSGVFGYWATHCNSEYTRTLSYADPLPYPLKSIEISISRNIGFREIKESGTQIDAIAHITSGRRRTHDPIDISYVSPLSSRFTIIGNYNWWHCTHVDVDVTLDSINLDNVEIVLYSTQGDITFDNTNGSLSENLKIKTLNGNINSNEMYVLSCEVTTYTGNINITNFKGLEGAITTLSGNIDIQAVSQNLKIKTSSGDISSAVTLVEESSTTPCALIVQSQIGSISLVIIDFPQGVTCNVKVCTNSGKVTVNARNFSGSYALQAFSGIVFFNGENQGTETTGNINGNSTHSISIGSLSGDVVFNIV